MTNTNKKAPAPTKTQDAFDTKTNGTNSPTVDTIGKATLHDVRAFLAQIGGAHE